MDSDTIQLGRSILYFAVGVLYLLSARRYSAIMKVERVFAGLAFLCFAISTTLSRMGNELFKPFNDGVLSTVIAGLLMVMVLLQLNGSIFPMNRRKGE